MTSHPGAGSRLLTPDQMILALVDHQPQMAFAVESHDRAVIRNNVTLLAKAARTFNVPVVLSTIAAQSLAGPLWPELTDVFPDAPVIDRTTMNAWEDPAFREAVQITGRRQLVIAGLWTEVCVAFPALSAVEDGFRVYAVADASGGQSREIHDRAMDRMVQAGVQPVTAMQVMLELQRDWARQATYEAVNQAVITHGGAYGLGVFYARAMLGVGRSNEGAPTSA